MNLFTECLPPFLDVRDYPEIGGYSKGRFCSPFPPGSNLTCCLPCPIQDYVYPDNFASKLKVAEYCAIPSLFACAFLLFSFVFLPPEKSQRHYLSVGLLVSVLLITVSFILPLGTNPDLCYDDVTPHDMYSDMSCAWTGALLQAGGMGAVVWVLLRTTWLHIRICWDREPGLMFLLISLVAGITIPAVFTASVLASSGVSYRTGQVCFANHDKSFAAYWAWLITFAGLSLVLQLITAVYCVYIFVRSQRREKARMRGGISSQNRMGQQGNQLRSGFEPVRHSSVEWRKIRRLFLLQWRGIAISILVVVQTVFFATTFIDQDAKLDVGRTSAQDMLNFQAWGTCLVFAGGNKNACLNLAEMITGGPVIVISSVVWAGLSGVICFLFLARTSMFTAWFTLLLTRPYHFLRSYLSTRRAPKDEEHNPFSYASDKEAAKRISTAPSSSPSSLSSPHRSAASRHRSRSSVISIKTTSSEKSGKSTGGGSASGTGNGHSPSNSQHKTLSIISESGFTVAFAPPMDKSLPPTPSMPATPRKTVPSKYRVPARLNPVPRIVAVGANAPTRVGLPKEVMIRGSREVNAPPPERKASLRASEAFPVVAARLAAEEELVRELGVGVEEEDVLGGEDGEGGFEGEEKKDKGKQRAEEEEVLSPLAAPTTFPSPPASPPPSSPLPPSPKQDIRHPSVLMPVAVKQQLAAAKARDPTRPSRSETPLWARQEEPSGEQQQSMLMPDPRTLLLGRGGLGMNPVTAEPSAASSSSPDHSGQSGEEEKVYARDFAEENTKPTASIPRKPVGGAAVTQAEPAREVEETKSEKKDEGAEKDEEVAEGEPSTPAPVDGEEASKPAPQTPTQGHLRGPSAHGPDWPLKSEPKTPGEVDEDRKDGTYFYAL